MRRLHVDLIIPVERDVPACTRDLLGADDTSHQAAGLWNDLGEFLQSRPTAHDGKRTTAELFEPDIIFHANHPGWLTLDSIASRPEQASNRAVAPDHRTRMSVRPSSPRRGSSRMGARRPDPRILAAPQPMQVIPPARDGPVMEYE
jgi:hypothetical protein